jgi:RNA polymerase sigma factor (sigma-70 family)
MDDSALLRQYAENHSDEAFAALVTRHVNLVYSVARRHVGDPHQAEEVTQAVFILLAQKAVKLRHDKALSSWLFQATRLTASNFVRSETRRHHREQEAHMQSLLDESGSDVWRQIAPLLDTAVADLSEKDRQAIVLRFYEGRNLREVGAVLGASEAAAEKRVSRAVEKLRTFFAKHGVTASSGALAVALGANAVQAAPVGLAATISTAAAMAGTTIAATATATAVKTIAMTTLQKTLITTTVAILAGAGIYEARQASRLREQVQTLQRQQAPLAEQVRQLQVERDEATRQLASLREDNERLNRNSAELLKLRGEVGVLRRESTHLASLQQTQRQSIPHIDQSFETAKLLALARAKAITLPKFSLNGVTLEDALLELEKAGKLNDTGRRGVSMMIIPPPEGLATNLITLDLEDVTLALAAAHVAQTAGLVLSESEYALIFKPKHYPP